MTIARPAASSNRHPRCGKGGRTLGAHRRWRTANRAGALETVRWAKMTPEEREEEAMDMVIRLATTINGVAFGEIFIQIFNKGFQFINNLTGVYISLLDGLL